MTRSFGVKLHHSSWIVFFGDIPEAASVGPPPGLADASGNPAHQGNVDPKDSFCDVPQARLWMQRVS